MVIELCVFNEKKKRKKTKKNKRTESMDFLTAKVIQLALIWTLLVKTVLQDGGQSTNELNCCTEEQEIPNYY